MLSHTDPETAEAISSIPDAPPLGDITRPEELQQSPHNTNQPVETKAAPSTGKNTQPKPTVFFAELLAKTQLKRTVGELKSSTETKKPATSTKKVTFTLTTKTKWAIADEKAERPQSTVTHKTQEMLASSAAKKSIAVREKMQQQVSSYTGNLAHLNTSIANLDKSTALPLAYLKSFLPLKINRILISSHLIALGYNDTSTPKTEQPNGHHARAINRALTHVITQDSAKSCREIESLSAMLAEKLMADILATQATIKTCDQADKIIDQCYSSICETLTKNNYILPEKSKDEKYLSYLAENLCRGIIGPKENALRHFQGIEFANTTQDDWEKINSDEANGYNHPRPGACTIL